MYLLKINLSFFCSRELLPGTSIQHRFNNTGDYNVTLTVKKPGYAKTATQVVRVVPKSDKIFVTNLRYEYFNKYTSYLLLFQYFVTLLYFV